MASNFVKVDASHYERLVRNNYMLDQIKRVLIRAIVYNQCMDGIICVDQFALWDELSVILDRGTLDDVKIRYNYLKDKYIESLKKEKSENDEIERECEA